MKNTIVVLTVLGFGWNHVLPDAQAATIDLAAADGVFLANTVAGGDGTQANAKSGTPNSLSGTPSAGMLHRIAGSRKPSALPQYLDSFHAPRGKPVITTFITNT